MSAKYARMANKDMAGLLSNAIHGNRESPGLDSLRVELHAPREAAVVTGNERFLQAVGAAPRVRRYRVREYGQERGHRESASQILSAEATFPDTRVFARKRS